MNKNTTLAMAIFCLFFLGNTDSLKAQINISLQDINACPGDVINVPVLVENFDGIGSITMAINYDPDALHYTGHVNPHLELAMGSFLTNADVFNGQQQVRASWYWIVPANVGTGTLVELIFEVKCNSSNLDFSSDPGLNEITNEFGDPLTINYTNSSLSVDDTSPVLTTPADGSTNTLTTLLVEWNAATSSCTPTYNVQIDEDPTWVTLVVDEGGISGTSYTATGLQPNTVYYCRVRVDSCDNWSSTSMFTTGLSVQENQVVSEISTYPNPVVDIMAVEFNLNTHSFVSVSVLDVLGNEVAQINFDNLNKGSHSSTIDLSGIPSGIYLINIETNDYKQINSFVKRIIKK